MSYIDKLLYLTGRIPLFRRSVDHVRALGQDVLRGLEAVRQITERNMSTVRDAIAYIHSTALPAYTASFESGVRVLEATSNGELQIDGVKPTASAHVLICGETDERLHGVYIISSIGGVSSKWKLTRHADFRKPSDYTAFRTLYAYGGTTNAFNAYRMVSPEYPKIDRDIIVFEKLSLVKPGGLWSGRTFLASGADNEAVLYLPPYGSYDYLHLSIETVTAGTTGDTFKLVRRRSDTLVDSDVLSVDISSSGARQITYPVLSAMSPVFSTNPAGLSLYPVLKAINGSGSDIPSIAVRYSFVRLA